MKNLCKLSVYLFLSIIILSACDFNPEILNGVNSEEYTSSSGETSSNYESGETMIIPKTGFGYANIDGTKIIVLHDHAVDNNKLLTHFAYAIGENGKSYRIEYSIWQESNTNDNNRQTMWNFINQAGDIYDVINATAIPNDTYMLLTQEEYDKIGVLQPTANSNITIVSNELLVRCSGLAERKAINGWQLSEYQNGVKVSILEFESIRKDLLAWLVIESDETLNYYEFPAILSDDGYTGWTIGDSGNLNEYENNLYNLCTIQNEQGMIVYLIWYSEEGEIVKEIEFFDGNPPNAKTVAGRYTFPI